jgi:CubicO group peptidase (beta-lactamase class C family)
MPGKQTRLITILVLAALSSAVAAAELDEAPKVRALMQKKVAPDGPGAVVGVLRDGKMLFHEGFGLANVAEKVPLKPGMVFDLASCSKQFTAMAIMILADRGKLTFDDDVRKHLPELHEHNLKLHHLLNMTSGLRDYTEFMDLEGKTNTDVLRAVTTKPLKFPAGEKYEYSNTNYALLALIVERVSKQDFARFMEENVFKPAGMKETLVLEHPKQMVKHRCLGYARDKNGIHKARNDTSIYGDGQVMTSVIEFGAWDRALRENKLVKPDTLAQAFTAGKLNNGKGCGYGFGWEPGQEQGHKLVFHTGAWMGTATYIVRDLDDGLTVIVLSNLEQFDSAATGDEVAAIFRKGEPKAN